MSKLKVNQAGRRIKPESLEENGFGSEVYICSEGKELDAYHPIIKLVASLARNRGVTFPEIHNKSFISTFYKIIALWSAAKKDDPEHPNKNKKGHV